MLRAVAAPFLLQAGLLANARCFAAASDAASKLLKFSISGAGQDMYTELVDETQKHKMNLDEPEALGGTDRGTWQ